MFGQFALFITGQLFRKSSFVRHVSSALAWARFYLTNVAWSVGPNPDKRRSVPGQRSEVVLMLALPSSLVRAVVAGKAVWFPRCWVLECCTPLPGAVRSCTMPGSTKPSPWILESGIRQGTAFKQPCYSSVAGPVTQSLTLRLVRDKPVLHFNTIKWHNGVESLLSHLKTISTIYGMNYQPNTMRGWHARAYKCIKKINDMYIIIWT